MPYFLVWKLCIKRLVHHAVCCIILVLSLVPFNAIPTTQNSVLRVDVRILYPTETLSPSHIQNTKDYYIITITSSHGPQLAGYGSSSALPHPASHTAAPCRTAPGPSNLCPSFLPTLITIHSSYGCLDVRNLTGPPRPYRPLLRVRGRFCFQIVPPCRQYICKLVQCFFFYSGY